MMSDKLTQEMREEIDGRIGEKMRKRKVSKMSTRISKGMYVEFTGYGKVTRVVGDMVTVEFLREDDPKEEEPFTVTVPDGYIEDGES